MTAISRMSRPSGNEMTSATASPTMLYTRSLMLPRKPPGPFQLRGSLNQTGTRRRPGRPLPPGSGVVPEVRGGGHAGTALRQGTRTRIASWISRPKQSARITKQIKPSKTGVRVPGCCRR